MTPRQRGFVATATAAMLVPALLHSATPIDWVNLANSSGVAVIPPGPGDVLGTLDLDRGRLGATGRLPEADELSAGLLADADDPSEFEDELPPLDGGFLREGRHGIPGVVLDAYMRAAGRLSGTTPGCRLDWPLLASIGRIESGHAHGGRVAEDGTTVNPILGPVLNGQPGMAAIRDTDGGRYDGDTTWDRAVGPMQFIPSTWAGYAADGNGDGERNPNNIYDATIGAGNYLCSGGSDLGDPTQRARSVFRYNQSEEYVRTVLYWADVYANGVDTLPDMVGSDDDFLPDPDPGTPPGNTPPGNTAPPGDTNPPGSTAPPSTSTSNPTTSTSPTRTDTSVVVPPGSTTSTTPTTPSCPTSTTPTTTPTGATTTTPTTTTTPPSDCPTTTTSTTTTTTTTTTTAAHTTGPADTTGPAGTPGSSTPGNSTPGSSTPGSTPGLTSGTTTGGTSGTTSGTSGSGTSAGRSTSTTTSMKPA